MRVRPVAVLALAATLGLAMLGAGCGNSDAELHVREGEPVKLDDLSYNVAITRELNPADAEDLGYLADQEALPDDKFWLGVFIQIHNDGDTAKQIASDFVITDTDGNEYHQVPSASLFALKPGATVEPDAKLPEPETAAATGPIQAAMLLFLMDDGATENRPLEMEIPSTSGEAGKIELDL